MTPNTSQSTLLPKRRSFPAGRHVNSPRRAGRRLRRLAAAARRLLSRMACLFLAVALLSTSTPAAPLVLAAAAAPWRGGGGRLGENGGNSFTSSGEQPGTQATGETRGQGRARPPRQDISGRHDH